MKHHAGWAWPDADVFMQHELQADGSYQLSHLERALSWVTAWELAIDGGAHVGTWARPMAAKFATVIAVEPAEDTFEALEANMVAFGCANVDCRNVAIGAMAGWVSMGLDPAEVARRNTGGRYIQAGQFTTQHGQIPMEPIDAWSLPALNFLKLDIEGSEFAAVMGARATITRCRPIILYENKQHWRRYGVERDGPAKLLTTLGYRQLEAVGLDVIWGPA